MTDEERATATARLHEGLARCGIETAEGLTDAEVAHIEETYAFRFPPDLRAFLQHALPVSPGWAEWRAEPDDDLRDQLNWPLEGICFDIENSGFWRDDWGPKPADRHAAFAVARERMAEVPTLIPICGHRYLPAEPCLSGNPVFSVYQTDIIHAGSDLADYFDTSFYSGWTPDAVTGEWTRDTWTIRPVGTAPAPRAIRFWDDFL